MKAKSAKPKGRPKPAKLNPLPSGERAFHREWIIVAAALLCDINSWGHQFVMDDLDYIVHNPVIQNPGHLLQIFNSPFVHFPSVTLDLYRPLTAFTLALNYWISGAQPDSFHPFNRLLHLLTCLGIFWTVRRLIPARPTVAFVTSLLFAVHPIQTEAITYISGRADALAMLLFVFAWLSFIRMRQAASPLFPYLTSAALYFLALLSKESAVTWLGVVLLTEWVYFSRGNIASFLGRLRGDFWRVYSGYLLITLAYLGLRFAVFRGIAITPTKFLVNPLISAGLAGRLLTSLKIFFQSIALLLFPLHFSPDYSFNQIPVVDRWASLAGLVTLLLTAAFLALLVWSYKRSSNLFFCLSYFVITYSIVSNLFVLIGTNRADRMLYMPALGFCLSAGFAWAYLEGVARTSAWKNTVRAMGVVTLLVLAGRTVVRNGDWQDQFTLYLRAVRHFSQSVKMHGYLGEQYFSRNEFAEARKQYSMALSIYPNQPDLLNDMGGLLAREGKLQEAIGYFQRALAWGPNDPESIRTNIGLTLGAQGNLAGAFEQFDWIIQHDPSNSSAHFNKGNVFYLAGKTEEAISEYNRALEIDPGNRAARHNLELLLQKIAPSSSTRDRTLGLHR